MKPHQMLHWFDAALLTVFRAVARRARPNGLMLVASGGIGDTIIFAAAAPVFAPLAEAGEPITVVTQTASAAAGFLLPPGFAQTTIDYRKFRRNHLYRARIGWRLFRLNARLAIATDYVRHPLADDAFIFYSDAPQRVGLAPGPWPKYAVALQANLAFYSRIVPVTAEPMHKYVRWLHIPAALTGQPLAVPPIQRDGAAARPHPVAPRVVLHPFASTRARQPSAQWFKRLLDGVPPGYGVVLSAGPGDMARNPDFAELIHDPRVTMDCTSLADKAAWLAGASLVVSVDTAIMHLAAMCGAPTICIASAAHVVDSVPYDPRMNAGNVRFISIPMECRGCLGNCSRPLVDDRYPCVEGIEVDAVTRMMADMLGVPTPA